MRYSLRIPRATAKRLPLYHNSLTKLKEQGQKTISSKELSELLGIEAAMIRKDLACFGEMGKRGVGYNIELLCRALGRALNLDQHWEIVLAGTGKLATALVEYNRLYGRNFRIVGVFAPEPITPGAEVEHLSLQPLSAMEKFVEARGIQMGILATAAAEAQGVVNTMVEVGVTAILNFTPVDVYVPENVKLVNNILTMEMQMLACCMDTTVK